MSGKAWGAVCVAGGLGLAFAGWRLAAAQRHPEGTTGFEGPGLNARGLKGMAGGLLMVLGLVLAVLIGPIFFIGG